MDSFLLNDLGRALYDLEKMGPLLGNLIFPSYRASSSEPVSRSHAGSRPPVSIPMVDLKMQTERLLGFWCGQLVRSTPGMKADFKLGIAWRARWLQTHLADFEICGWADLAAREIVAQAVLVAEVVTPPVEKTEVVSVTKPRRGTTRAVVGWVREQGVEVSRAAVLRWIDAGVVQVFPDHRGRKLVSFDEVLAVATRVDH